MTNRITALPPAPQRTEPPATFANKADVFVAALSPFVTEANLLADEVNTNADDAEAAKTAAEQARDAALGVPNLLNWKGVWTAGTYALGDSVFYDGAYYISDAGGNTDEPPAGAWRELDVVLTYPDAGIPVSTGSAWGTSKAAPSGVIVGTTDTQTLTAKTLGNYTETVFAITDGTTVNLDPNNGPIQTWTLGANRTPGQANWAEGQSITLLVDDGAAYAITWSTLAVAWKTEGGAAPTLNTDTLTVIALWKVGATIYGARVGNV